MTGLVHSEACPKVSSREICGCRLRLYRDPDHVIEVKPRLLLSVLIANDPLFVVDRHVSEPTRDSVTVTRTQRLAHINGKALVLAQRGAHTKPKVHKPSSHEGFTV